jgi:AcrR family transcriptional regulator
MTRADVRRNHERLLAAAGEAFLRHGVDASLNDIARRAGVGPATLYRHFPSREALLEALLVGRYNDLASQARDLLAEPSPRDALVAWLRVFTAHVTTYRGLATPVKAALLDETSALFSSCRGMKAAWQELLAHAQRAGAARADVDSMDVLRLANAVAWATDGRPDETDRLLSLVLDGIRG